MLHRSNHRSGFALVVTLIMMALIVVVVVAYLGNTRTDRSASSLYANRLRAKMIADSGLAAATKLLYDNTKYGNYVTAMPAPPPPSGGAAPAPTPIRTELYRPVNPATSAASPDYLRLNNAIGEVLVSRADTAALPAPPPQVDPRPPGATIPVPPTGDPWGLAPSVTTTNSFDFNQIVRVATNNSGRLVHPDGQPAYGEWVRVRNENNQLIGRYAFFIEDESMKVNLDVTGNAAGSPHLRVNDLTAVPAATPASQIQEIDPAALLPSTANRAAASSALTALGLPGARLPTSGTTALLDEWKANTPDDYAHLITVRSKDDHTTARGWQRLDLNAIVAAAEKTGGNAAKVDAAQKIADWIRDAWTGVTQLADLKQDADGRHYQLFSDDRLRLQIAANIVDYIDTDNIPTDVGDKKPTGFAGDVPVIGIEKIPYLGHVFVIYEASGSNGTSATLRVKLRFTFFNLYESNLDLQQSVTRIEVQGIPAVFKNNAPVFNKPGEKFSIPVSKLTPLHADGFIIKPADLNGNVVTEAGSGARSFESDWVVAGETVTFTGTQAQRPEFRDGGAQLEVRVFGGSAGAEVRLDATASQTQTGQTGYQRGAGGDSTGNFLGTSATPRTTAAIYEQKRKPGSGATQDFGDPRFRPALLNDRWRRVTTVTDPQAVADRMNKMDTSPGTYPNPRVYAVDWFDNYANRPFAFLRNGSMLNIGELGNVSFSEYPWRTGYLQQPERPAVSSDSETFDEVTARRSGSVDHVLVDLFRAGMTQRRNGALNINTQQQRLPSGSTSSVLPFQPLFLGVPLGTASPPLTLSDTGSAPAATRLSTGVSVVVNTMTTPPKSPAHIGSDPKAYSITSLSNRRVKVTGQDPTPGNDPLRPFFAAGELAPVLSRLLSASEASDVSSSDSSTRVVYSALRNTPTTINQANANYKQDMLVEQAFREVSNSITTRGDVFRVLYVGQAIRDQKSASGQLGEVENSSEVAGEFLGEAYVEREAVFTPDSANPNAMRTSDSKYRILSTRVITE